VVGTWSGDWRTDLEASPGGPAYSGSVPGEAAEQNGAFVFGPAAFTGAPCFDNGRLTVLLEEDEGGEASVVRAIGTVEVSDEIIATVFGSAAEPPPEGCADWEMGLTGTLRDGERIIATYDPTCLPPPCSDISGTTALVRID